MSGLPSEVRAAAAGKKMSVNGQSEWAKLSWSERKVKADAVNEADVDRDMVVVTRRQKARAENRKQCAERTAKLHPDDEQRRKFHLIISAIESLRGGPRAQIPDGTDVALWIDWCCINQDRRAENDKNVKREVRNVHNLIASCDLVLTIVVDPDHTAWRYPAVWAPHEGVSQAASLTASGGRESAFEELRVIGHAGRGAALRAAAPWRPAIWVENGRLWSEVNASNIHLRAAVSTGQQISPACGVCFDQDRDSQKSGLE